MKGGGHEVETWVKAVLALDAGIMFTRSCCGGVTIICGGFTVEGKTLHTALDTLQARLEYDRKAQK